MNLKGPKLPVPASEYEVNATWLRDALSTAFPDDHFELMDLCRIGADYGFASRIFRGQLRGHRSLSSVVIKFWNTDTPAGSQEVLFYRTFGPAVGTRVPACLYAAVDPVNQRGVLILEDIARAVQGDCLQVLTLDQAKTVAHNLAAMHARWVEHPLLEAEWLRSLSEWQPDGTWFATRRALFLERFESRLDPLTRLVLDRIEHIPAIASERLGGASKTLLHADLHLDNILFEKNVQPVFLDWARCAKGPLALDLTALLFDMCHRENIDDVFAVYLESLREQSSVALDAAVVRLQLGGALLRRFCYVTCGISRWQPVSQRGLEICEVHIRRAVEAVQYWSEQDADLFAFVK